MGRIKTTIIGAGSIGALKPDKYDSKETKYPLTHAHALWLKAMTFDLQYIVDKNPGQAKAAMEKWDCDGGTSIHDAPDDTDVFVIATPTENHMGTFHKICDCFKPKVIVVEKPFCMNEEQARQCLAIAGQNEIKVIVNYTRRYSWEYITFKEALEREEIEIYGAILKYGRGIKRDGCHGIDLFNWFLGKCTTGGALYGTDCPDYDKNDPSVAAILHYKKCPAVYMMPVDSRVYGIFELELLHSKGRTVFENNGSIKRCYCIKNETEYGDYKALSTFGTSHETDLRSALTNLYVNVRGVIERMEPPMCSGVDAVNVHRVIEMIKEKGE